MSLAPSPPAVATRKPPKHLGTAQLSVLETALCPLNAKLIRGGAIYRSKFFFTPQSSNSGAKPRREVANVRVTAPLGLLPNDEYALWGLLAVTLNSSDADSRLLATPHWCLKQLGLPTSGGRQYAAFRDSLDRLACLAYHCDNFYNPIKKTHEFATFGFFDILLPADLESSRAWEIRWNSVFFEFCEATGGKLLFDLDLFRKLDYASRRLFLKLKDRFWRRSKAEFDLTHLMVDGLGFSETLQPKHLKQKLTRCIERLRDHGIVTLPDGVDDPRQLFTKKGKGTYRVSFHRGPYFDQSPTITQPLRGYNDPTESPLYEPLRNIGFGDVAIRRILKNYPRRLVENWSNTTLTAMENKPRGFPGFKVSPQAYCMDGIKNRRALPDWFHAERKREEKRQWEERRRQMFGGETDMSFAYQQARKQAFQQFLAEEIRKGPYHNTFRTFVEIYQTQFNEPAARDAATKATHRHYEARFPFPLENEWIMQKFRPTGAEAA